MTNAVTELPWDLPAPHILPVTVQPQHIDLMRHTNNVVYLQWLEDVAWSHSKALGVGPETFHRLGLGLVVRQHELTYVQATRLDEALLLGTWVTQVDKLALRRQYQFIRPADGATVFRGHSHFLCVEIESGKLRRMAPEFLELYGRAVASH
ncbi:MAG: acyl-CoA thioesterase [Burkholderiales bacterium]|nr:acyl-CoA thioesterase [Burkholderiales bacterium]MDE2433851.1 acyl-CoA thioesterase [Burkholderiales bacterium]